MSLDPSAPAPPSSSTGATHNYGPSQQGTGNVQNNYYFEDRRLERRIVLLWSSEDQAKVDQWVGSMRNIYRLDAAQPCRVEAPATEGARAALRAELEAAEQIWVFWSAAARRSPFVRAALALVEEIEDAESAARPPSSQEPTRLVPAPLDDTVLMPPLKRRMAIALQAGGRPLQAALYSGLNLLGGLGAVGLAIWGWRDGGQGPLWWAAVVGLIALAIAFGAAQLADRAELVFTAGAIFVRGGWLETAKVHQILAVSERVLNCIYGETLVSRRSLGMSALVGTGAVLPLSIIWGWFFEEQLAGVEGQYLAWKGALAAAFAMATTTLLNLLFDFLALLATRTILKHLLLEERGIRVGLGLVLDVVLVGAAATMPFVLNLPARWTLGGAGYVMTNPLAVGSHLVLLLTGGLNLANLYRGVSAAGLLMCALSVITGCLPSLVHGSLLLVNGLNRALRGVPLRQLGRALRRLADRPAGPQDALVPLGALLLGIWSALVGLRSSEPPPAGLVSVPLETCAQGCTLRSPAVEGSRVYARERIVQLHTSYELQPAELTQRQWAWVMQKAAEADLEVWGLPVQPSVYRGKHLPVDSVSWCEAARFANLWSLVEGLPPAYSVENPPEGEDRHGLPGCEDFVEILWDHASTGYRLPSEVEWEVAARGCQPQKRCSEYQYRTSHGAGLRIYGLRWPQRSCSEYFFHEGDRGYDLLRVAWVCANSGWRPHPVASREPNSLGLHDMLGNVWEWTWDAYTRELAAGIDPAVVVLAGESYSRVVRGGSWSLVPYFARTPDRYMHSVRWRDVDLGFRLVRSVGPSSSGSGP